MKIPFASSFAELVAKLKLYEGNRKSFPASFRGMRSMNLRGAIAPPGHLEIPGSLRAPE